ncbi:MAG: hypothetical protein H6607_07635 [Flavobacteriales bacterium]|nr:hypothetical protein [Flavobacteriales bacterium]
MILILTVITFIGGACQKRKALRNFPYSVGQVLKCDSLKLVVTIVEHEKRIHDKGDSLSILYANFRDSLGNERISFFTAYTQRDTMEVLSINIPLEPFRFHSENYLITSANVKCNVSKDILTANNRERDSTEIDSVSWSLSKGILGVYIDKRFYHFRMENQCEPY